MGNYHGAELECVRQHGIEAVVTAAKDCDIVSFKPEDKVEHMRLDDADDTEEYEISTTIFKKN